MAYFLEDWLCIRLPYRNYEAALIDVARSGLGDEDRRRLAHDLDNVRRASRYNDGRMVLLPARKGAPAAGFEGADDVVLAACRLKSPRTGAAVTARLIAYAGRLHRMEFSPSPHAIWGEDLSVTPLARPGRSRLAEQIDREEHDG
ncbi:MAG: hypothetical protein Q7T61_17635 [Caulobacter sp.]|nr:hypothetical protein [Caulobacter sp.]